MASLSKLRTVSTFSGTINHISGSASISRATLTELNNTVETTDFT